LKKRLKIESDPELESATSDPAERKGLGWGRPLQPRDPLDEEGASEEEQFESGPE